MYIGVTNKILGNHLSISLLWKKNFNNQYIVDATQLQHSVNIKIRPLAQMIKGCDLLTDIHFKNTRQQNKFYY